MGFLYILEDLRVPFLTELMLAVTKLGEETAFLVIALIVFWCVDKRRGYYLMAVGFIGTILNQMVKLSCRIPRPWVLDPEFTIVEQAREAAAGYSFPSGHTQFAVGTFAALGRTCKKRWIKCICITCAVLVPFSRMYLGVHTLKDVLVGTLMAGTLVAVFQPLVFSEKKDAMKLLIGGMIALAVVFVLYVEFWPFPVELDAYNYESGLKNAYTMLGCLIGVAIVYVADEKWLHFPVEAKWWVQIIKSVVGLGPVLIVKSVLKAPLDALLGGHMAARGLRYFLVVVTAGVIWPMSFQKLAKLGWKSTEEV